jgi:hypothetical protein
MKFIYHQEIVFSIYLVINNYLSVYDDSSYLWEHGFKLTDLFLPERSCFCKFIACGKIWQVLRPFRKEISLLFNMGRQCPSH